MEHHIGAVIAKKRIKAGFTRNGLAVASGIDGGYLYRIETGEVVHPSWDTVCALADALGCSLDDLRRVKITAGNEQ